MAIGHCHLNCDSFDWNSEIKIKDQIMSDHKIFFVPNFEYCWPEVVGSETKEIKSAKRLSKKRGKFHFLWFSY